MKLMAEKSITLTSSEYPPYYGKELYNRGPVTEIIIKAFEQVGYRVKIDFFPWARSEDFAKKGNVYQGMLAPWKTEKREQLFYFSDPLLMNVVGFYKRKKDPISFNSYSDLSPFIVGTVIGYANPPGFDEAVFTKSFTLSDKQNMNMLCNHRVDLIIIDKFLAKYILKTQFPECATTVEWMEASLLHLPQYLVISKHAEHAEEILDAFNLGLQRLKDTAAIKDILIKHDIYETLLESGAIVE